MGGGLLYEIIVVNDGSSDRTLRICQELQKILGFRIICLTTNSGHMAAITAGLEASSGNLIATMDADLQDPPKDLLKMYQIITADKNSSGNSEIDVVQAFRIDRHVDSMFKRITASMYYKTIEKITGIKIVHHAADFRIMTREVVTQLLNLPERNRIYRLLIPKLGFRIRTHPIVRAKRYAGTSKYPFNKMLKLSIDSVFAFTNKPLRYLAYLGLIASAFFFFASFAVLTLSLIFETVPGWPSLVLLLLGANAFLFAGLGLLGEYIGRIYELIQARPIANWHEIK